jgi:hypothetical protein
VSSGSFKLVLLHYRNFDDPKNKSSHFEDSWQFSANFEFKKQ